MAEVVSKLEAVRVALQELGKTSSQNIAAYIESQYGMQVQPTIITVLLGSIEEQEHLARVRELAKQIAEQIQKEGIGQRKKGGKRKKNESSSTPVVEGPPTITPGSGLLPAQDPIQPPATNPLAAL